jgi:uncharacterized membrane protein YeaQ/YmgE (transglycosylase-associated protein family)
MSVDLTDSERNDIMHIIWMLGIGLLFGALARLVMPGRDPRDIVTTMLLGVVGSFAAGFIGQAIGWYEWESGGGLLLACAAGSALLLLIYRLIGGSRWSSVWRR